MRKLIVLTLAFMAFGLYESRYPHKVAVSADSEEVSDRCGEMKAELEKIKAELNRLENLVSPPVG
jgi:hypothetical protein